MEFGLSDEQVALQDSVNHYLNDCVGLEQVRAVADGGDYREIWSGLAELGVTSLLLPEDQGGLGLTILDAALVAECLGTHVAPSPFIGSAVIAPLALQHAARGLAASHLTQLVDGSITAGFAFSELAGARGDAGVQAAADKLSGKSMFVLDPSAELLLVATIDKALYLVESGAAGLQQLVHQTVDRTRVSGELRFDNTPAHLVTDNPDIVDGLMDAARVMLVADTLGAAQHMLDAAVAYAKERKQFNRVIGSFQAVKHLCAEMIAELEPCRAMMWYAAYALDELPEEARVTACHAKAHISEVGTFVARTATEVHGGIGFTDLLGLHYWFKRIGYNRQALGGPEVLREHAAALQGLE
jgi:alkylation response protein AidB-like acyl-CoA dehydrogenase